MNITSAPALGETANGFARHAADTAQHALQSTREAALRASDRTVGYIRDEPVRAVAFAAGAGAVAAVLAWLLARSLRPAA